LPEERTDFLSGLEGDAAVAELIEFKRDSGLLLECRVNIVNAGNILLSFLSKWILTPFKNFRQARTDL